VALAAKQGDRITASDTHMIQPPGPSSPALVPGHQFNGLIGGGLSGDVNIERRAAATVDSTATNTPPHVPLGGSFVTPPTNQGTIIAGSRSVFINGKAAARAQDTARTCNDPVDAPVGTVQVAQGTVDIGD
jgi:uncharacterized Zn-binding protein involved in type VI secretion